MNKKQVIYYTDELHDEFSSFTTTPPVIGDDYDYERSSFGKKLGRFFVYRIFTYPVAFLYSKFAFGRKIVGKSLLKPYRRQGIFLYGNHTQPTGDALMQACLTWPRTNYVIVHPNNLKVPFIGRFTPALGALPVPDTMGAFRNFRKAIEHKIRQGHPVVIYPEAHIWPYYTKIRPFADTSFAYPVSLKTPVFCFVNTYQKRKHGSKPKMVTYIQGPFFADDSLNPKEQRKKLRDEVYASMSKLAENSNCEVIEYRRKEEENG